MLGTTGNTGKVGGSSCPEHPGTHLHFAVYQKQQNGTLAAYKPEPISGYSNLLAGNWYVSDNELYAPAQMLAQKKQTEPSVSGNSFLTSVSSWFLNLFSGGFLMSKTQVATAPLSSDIAAAFKAAAAEGAGKPSPADKNNSLPPRPTPKPKSQSVKPALLLKESSEQTINQESSVPTPPPTLALQSQSDLAASPSAPPSQQPASPPQEAPAPDSQSGLPPEDPAAPPLQVPAPQASSRAGFTPIDPPAITTPKISGAYLTNSNSLPVIGANSHDTENIVIRANSKEQIFSAWPYNGRWSNTIILQEGENKIRLAARDVFDHESPEQNYLVILDTTPPDQPTFTSPFSPSSAAPGVSVHFEGTKSEDTVAVEVNFGSATSTIITSFATSTAWQTDFTFDEGIYEVSARGGDEAGNWSGVATTTLIVAKPAPKTIAGDVPATVVINEIAWMGTNASADDEWLELFNATGDKIDLTGWKLASASGTPSVDLKGVIPAYGYFLLERTRDDVISNIAAGQFFTGALNNPGERLELWNGGGEAVDVVDASSGWFAGENKAGSRRSMARIDPDKFGSDSANWQTSDSSSSGGLDKNGAPVGGTPVAPNHAPGYLFGDTTGTLSFKNSPYILSSASVPAGATLTIEPGVVIKSSEGILTVNGALKAAGTTSRPIVFTSYADDDYGGDTNKNSTPPARGDWRWIILNGGGSSDLENVRVRYGGYWPARGQAAPQIQAFGGSLNLRGVTVESGALGGSGGAISFENTAATLENCLILNNQNGVAAKGGTLSVKGCQFKENKGYGLSVTDTAVAVQESAFINNEGAAISAINVVPAVSGVNASGNLTNGVTLGGTLSQNAVMTSGIAYQLNTLTVGSGAVLTMAAGVVGKLHESGLTINGALVTEGVADASVVLTSLYDNAVAAGFYGRSSPPPAGGDWEWLAFGAGSGSSRLKNTVIRYGGYRRASGKTDAQVVVDTAPVILENVTIEKSHSLAAGAHFKNASAAMKNCLVKENKIGLWIEGGAPTIESCEFVNNQLGMAASAGAAPKFIDLIFSGNTQNTDPAGLWP